MPRSCAYRGHEYPDGSVVCQDGKEYRCTDGTWVSLGTICGAIANAPAISKDASLAAGPSCLQIFAAGIGQVGMRNNCAECKIAVVIWRPNVGLRHYRVEGNSEVIISLEDQSGILAEEIPC